MKSTTSGSTKRAYVVLAFVGLLLASQVEAAIPQSYSLTDLGSSWAWAISEEGHVVGANDNPPGGWRRGYLWKDGTSITLDVVTGAILSDARGVNDFGDVAGWGVKSGHSYGFYWRDANLNGLCESVEMLDLGSLGGTGTIALGINNSGQVVGQSLLASDNHYHAFVWGDDNHNGQAEPGEMIDLGPGQANAINNLGAVVGRGNLLGSYDRATLWQGGAAVDLGVLGGVVSCALGVSDSGYVVGWTDTIDPTVIEHAFKWADEDGNGQADPGEMLDLDVLGTRYSGALGVNNHGQAVGWAGTNDSDVRAFIWSDDQMVNLNDLIAPGSGWVLSRANDINDAGEIVGYGTVNGQAHGFLLTPIPEPATLSLLAVAAIALLRRNQRRT